MRDLAIVILVILAIIGACAIAGSITRGTDDLSTKDEPQLYLFRGFAVVCIVLTIIGFLGGILYLIFN